MHTHIQLIYNNSAKVAREYISENILQLLFYYGK